jgi:hypothetical protein
VRVGGSNGDQVASIDVAVGSNELAGGRREEGAVVLSKRLGVESVGGGTSCACSPGKVKAEEK